LLGRERHLRELEEAFTASRRAGHPGHPARSSGVGKSTLAEHFLAGLRTSGVVVLAGRCCEHEAVPYKAIDPIVGALARYLRALPAHEAAECLPRDVGPLTRVFPVLAASPRWPAGGPLAPLGGRPRRTTPAFSGLAKLLARIGDRHPLALPHPTIAVATWTAPAAGRPARLLPIRRLLLLLASFRARTANSPCCAPWPN